MNDSGGQTITLFASAMFILSGGGYATIAACILSACTSAIAFLKGKHWIAYIFAFAFMVYISGIALYYTIPMFPEYVLTVVKIARHLGKIAQVIPFVVVLMMLIRLPAQRKQAPLMNTGAQPKNADS